MKKTLTLLLVHTHQSVLLGMKKRGFGEGKWNGFGGKVDTGETIEDAAIRELREEAGIAVHRDDMRKHGVLTFSFEEHPDILDVHIFSANKHTGKPRESDEMLPKWFPIDKIPYDSMWSDDIYWLPELLQGRCFSGTFHFTGENNDVMEHSFSLTTCPK